MQLRTLIHATNKSEAFNGFLQWIAFGGDGTISKGSNALAYMGTAGLNKTKNNYGLWNIVSFFAWWKRHLRIYHLIARTPYGVMVQMLGGHALELV